MVESIRDMPCLQSYRKLEKFKGNDSRRSQMRMFFLLATLKVMYVSSTPNSEVVAAETLDQTGREASGRTIIF